MNPAILILATLSLAGLLVRRSEAGMAWAISGLIGMLFLAPTLAIPDGIPSPAADLAREAPWQGLGEERGNPTLVDITYQVQPWLLHLRRELRAGHLPFWNPHQSAGSPFWANGQSAPLFPLHWLFVLLPVQLGFVLLPWLRFTVAGTGTWLLARELGLSRPAALVAAVIFPLSGMFASFVLFPMANALALVPWLLRAVERLAAGQGSWIPIAGWGGLQLLSGHPETALHTAFLSGLYLLVRGSTKLWTAIGQWAAGWAMAALVAAGAILPLALNLFESSKWRDWSPGGSLPLGLMLLQPLRLLLPHLYGFPPDGTWFGPFNYSATAIYVGAATLPLAAAGLGRARGDRRWLAVAILLLLCFLFAYHIPGARELLAAIPILGRALQHRLIFGIELTLALLAGAGCDLWLEGKGRGIVGGAALAVGGTALAWLRFGGEWRQHELVGMELGWTALVAGAAIVVAASLFLSREKRWRVFPLLPALLAVDLLAAHGRINPGLSMARLYPETSAISWLRSHAADGPFRVAGVASALRPNTAMVFGLTDLRGDDPVKLARFEAISEELAEERSLYFRPIRNWRSPWLDRLSLRWVLAPPEAAPPDPSWTVAWQGSEARIFERPGALPLVRWAEERGAGPIEILERRPGRWRLRVQAERQATLAVAEMAAQGWQARVDGDRRELTSSGEPLLAVGVEPGDHEVSLNYRPPGAAAGLALSLFALAGLATATVVRPRFRN